MNVQTELNFAIVEPNVKTLNDVVLTLLSDGRWWAPWELCDEILRTKQVRISDSTVSARIRDNRKPQYGGHTILIRKRSGSRAFEYKLER